MNSASACRRKRSRRSIVADGSRLVRARARDDSESVAARRTLPSLMGARRNVLTIVLATAGCTLFGLAVIDWLDYLWVIVYHASVR